MGCPSNQQKRGLTFKVVPFFNIISLLRASANDRHHVHEVNGIRSIAQASMSFQASNALMFGPGVKAGTM